MPHRSSAKGYIVQPELYDMQDESGEWAEVEGTLTETEQPEATNGPNGDTTEYWAGKGTINGLRVNINYEFPRHNRPELAEDYDWDDVYSLTLIVD